MFESRNSFFLKRSFSPIRLDMPQVLPVSQGRRVVVLEADPVLGAGQKGCFHMSCVLQIHSIWIFLPLAMGTQEMMPRESESPSALGCPDPATPETFKNR